ncbi:hypothetical protein KKE07_00635, partial [Candidatus Dependentiae bacterium]|nr:hypothetical protein [Candidatus Dependentiae bacterium]
MNIKNIKKIFSITICLFLSKSLFANKISFDEAIERLKNNDPTLTILSFSFYLHDFTMTKERIIELAKVLETNTSLTNLLYLAGNNIGPEGAFALAKALETNKSLTNLYLSSNNIGPTGAIALAKALEKNTSLTTLDLYYNSIGPEGDFALAKALETNKSLTTLELSNNNLGNKGDFALAKALETNKSLTNLYLSCNNIGPTGAIAFAKALEINKSLTTLDLAVNNIGPAGAIALAKALEKNTTLSTLYLQYNNIEDKVAVALTKALKINTTLTGLNLSNNNIQDYSILSEINFYLSRNKKIKAIYSNNIGNEKITLYLPESYDCCNVGELEFERQALTYDKGLMQKRLGLDEDGVEIFIKSLITDYGNDEIFKEIKKYNKHKSNFKTKEEIEEIEKFCEFKKNKIDFLKKLLLWINTGVIYDLETKQKIINLMKDLKLNIEDNDRELFVGESFDDLLVELHRDEKSKDFKIKYQEQNSLNTVVFVHSFILDLKTRLFKEFKAAINDGNIIDDKTKTIPYYGESSLDALKIFIKFLYTNNIELNNDVFKKELLLDLWDLAN